MTGRIIEENEKKEIEEVIVFTSSVNGLDLKMKNQLIQELQFI